jgi:hypothetical protein
MIETPKIRSSFRVANCLLVFFLAIFVVNWGLQYKLSLYRPSEAVKPTLPEAKLLSGKELTIWSSATVRHVAPAPVLHAPPAVLPTAGFAESPTLITGRLEPVPRPTEYELRRLPAAFSRPPPQNL